LAATEARPEPSRDCPLCPRLAAFREAWRAAEPGWANAPVPAFGPPDAALLVVGLAPGLRGANRTGRAFTGDYAGLVLYPALRRHGFARGPLSADPEDGSELVGCRIANATRCVPPQNRPTPLEVATCRRFLAPHLAGGPSPPRVILTLGRVAHEAALRALGLPPSRHPFAHGAEHRLPTGQALLASYHTSRYNVNTGVLTPEMFDAVVARAAELVAAADDGGRGEA
jgi:uracil-DNA glycosylase